MIDAQAAAIPEARFAFINAHGSNDFIDHARDERGADDLSSVVVDGIAVIAALEDVLLLAEHGASQGPVTVQFIRSARDLEDKITRTKRRVGIE